MPTTYDYPVYKSGELIGYFCVSMPLRGTSVVVPEEPLLKERYGRRLRTITIPIKTRVSVDSVVRYTVEFYLDVTHKSNRQIELLRLSSLGKA